MLSLHRLFSFELPLLLKKARVMCFFLFCLMQLAGKNSHHIIEATFKAFARALRQATEYDHRRAGTVPRFVTLTQNKHIHFELESAVLNLFFFFFMVE